jgi:mannosyltransferase
MQRLSYAGNNIALKVFPAKAHHEFIFVTGIILLALLLRFYKLGEWSFWGDEVFSLGVKEDGFNYSIWRQSFAITLIRMATSSFGMSEWSARFAPAVIGVLSIPILYFFLRYLFGSYTALAASLFLAVSPWHLYWSQNARFYTLLLLFYTLALLTFFIGFERDRPWFVLLSLFFLGLAARERLLALFFLPTIVAYFLLIVLARFPKPAGWNKRNLALLFVPLVVLGVFFGGPYLKNMSGWLQGFSWVNNNPFWITAGVVYYVGLPVIVTAIFGSIYLLYKKDRAALLFALAAVLPLTAITILSMVHYTANRYVFLTLTSWLLLAAFGVREIFRAAGKQNLLLSVGVIALLVVSSLSEDVLYHTYQNGNRENGKAAYLFVRENWQEGDALVAANTEVADYYTGIPSRSFWGLDTNNLAAYGRRIWFVEDMNTAIQHPQQRAWVISNARQYADFDVSANARLFLMRVYLYLPGE